jgi:hypothetical protein
MREINFLKLIVTLSRIAFHQPNAASDTTVIPTVCLFVA